MFEENATYRFQGAVEMFLMSFWQTFVVPDIYSFSYDVQGSMAWIGAILPIAEWEDAASCMHPATLLHSADSNSNGWREC